MNTEFVHSWVQTLTAIAVAIGLVLVIIELRQSREATMSQLSSEGYSYSSQIATSIIGEEPAEALAKACFEPQLLTKADLFRLEAIYTQRLQTIDRLISLSERGSFYSDDYWRIFSPVQFSQIFVTDVGRNYWQNFRHLWREEIRIAGDLELSNAGAPDCRHDEWQAANNLIQPAGEGATPAGL